MRLSKYILLEGSDYENPGRGKEISMEEAIKIAPKFSEAINASTVITRVSSTAERYSYYLVDPKKSKVKRGSRNTLNYYTEIIDNSSSWKKYPKRSESLIASANRKYGLRLLPKNGSKIGVCPSPDFWFSFLNSFEYSMDRINDALDEIFRRSNDMISKFDKSLESIKTACKNFDNWYENQEDIKNMIEREFGKRWTADNVRNLLKDYKGNLFKMIESKLSSDKNGFKLITTSNIDSISGKVKEIWTDGESLMVRCDEWQKFYKEV